MTVLARLPLWVAALWWGSLSTVGFLVVPLLFTYLPTPAIAGAMAAKLFAAQSWLSLACGLLLLMFSRANSQTAAKLPVQSAITFIVLGMLLALLSEFAVAPRILVRENLRLWHAVGSTMYLLQWLCATATILKLSPTIDQNNQV